MKPQSSQTGVVFWIEAVIGRRVLSSFPYFLVVGRWLLAEQCGWSGPGFAFAGASGRLQECQNIRLWCSCHTLREQGKAAAASTQPQRKRFLLLSAALGEVVGFKKDTLTRFFFF